jgi:capping protein alpha
VEAALEGYLRDCYAPNGHAAVYGHVGAEDGRVRVTVCISSAQFNPKNYWNGRVRARWVATLPAGAGAGAGADSAGAIRATLAGKLCADVHYFEEGNVQLATSHDATAVAEARGGDDVAAALGGAIVASLRAAEGDYFSGLEASFDALASRTFKELRRALPVTRSKFPWEQAQHKLAVELATKERTAAAAAAAAAR